MTSRTCFLNTAGMKKGWGLGDTWTEDSKTRFAKKSVTAEAGGGLSGNSVYSLDLVRLEGSPNKPFSQDRQCERARLLHRAEYSSSEVGWRVNTDHEF